MKTIKNKTIKLDEDKEDYKDVNFIDCIIRYFMPSHVVVENCHFENCEFEQRMVGDFSPNFMTNCTIENCLFENNKIKSASVNGYEIKYTGVISNNIIEILNSKKAQHNSLANAESFLIEEGYDGQRGGLSIIFDGKQYPELKDYIKDSDAPNSGYINFRLLTSPYVRPENSEDIKYYFDGVFTELPEDYENDYDLTKEDIQQLNEDAKECYLQTIKILNGTIGKDLDWKLTFTGYQIDAEHFVSVWAYDEETNIIYQKCQMAYNT